MIVFLTSSPCGSLDDSHRVDGLDKKNSFVENLRKYWPECAKGLAITASPESYEENDGMAAFFGETFQKEGFSVSGFDVWDGRMEDFSAETLQSYDVVILGGGHVPTQNAFFRKIGLREKLEDFQGIVIGISAGTMNSADTVYAQPELPGEAVDPHYVRFLRGLGLTKTMVLPHYQMLKHERLDGLLMYEDIACGDSFGRRFLALPDGSYVLRAEGTEIVWGEAYEVTEGQIRLFCEDERFAVI